MKQPFRKPLIIFTPKSLLRNPVCVSDLVELSSGGFKEVIPDSENRPEAGRVLLCSGKIYYELKAQLESSGRKDTAIIRIEQLYPFSGEPLQDALGHCPQDVRIAWVQEEPENMGAWPFLRVELERVLGKTPLYIGRPAAAAPAVGSHRLHGEEQQRIIEEAFAHSQEVQ